MPSGAETARTILGIIGNAISFFLFLSPMPSIVDAVAWKSTRDYSTLPYLLTLFNCLLWILYGIPAVHPHSLLVLTINSIGAAYEMFYISIFVLFAPSQNERRKRIGSFLLLLQLFFLVVVLVLKCGHTQESRSFVVGILCAVFGTCMYAAPLIVMKRVIKTKSVEFMPFWLSLASFLNALVWTAYAVLHIEIFVMIPNALGILLGASQLILYGTYYRKKGNQQPVDREFQLPTIATKGATNSMQPASL